MKYDSPPPQVLLLTRHQATLDWLRRTLRAPQARQVEHLGSIDSLHPGDMVAGTLPFHLAAALCRRGVLVLVFDLPLASTLRGAELDACQIQAAGARLTRYHVTAEPWPAGLSEGPAPIDHERLLPASADGGSKATPGKD